MRQLLLTKEHIVIKESVQPVLHESAVLVAVHYMYIMSHTNIFGIKIEDNFFNNMPHKVKRAFETVSLQAIEANKQQFSMQSINKGYSCVGQVISIGKKVTQCAPGDFVVFFDTGNALFTDIVCVAEQLVVKIPNKNFLKQASIVPFAAGALGAIRRAKVQIGEWVGVYGLDAVGLLTVYFARLAGALVVAMDSDPQCLSLARLLGAVESFHITNDNIPKEVDLITEQYGMDTLFLSNKNLYLLDQASLLLRSQGKLVLLGTDKGVVYQKNHVKDIDIIVIHDVFHNSIGDAPLAARWSDNRNMRICLAWLQKGAVSFDFLLEDQVSIKKLSQAYQKVQKRLSIGVLLSYEQGSEVTDPVPIGENEIHSISENIRFVPAEADILRVGVVGTSDFMHTVAIPIISKMRNTSINGIFTNDTKKTSDISGQNGAIKLYLEEEMHTHQALDVLMIATAHSSHSDYALQALKHGKAVFIEKPMIVNWHQFQQFFNYLEQNKNAPLCVGYSYSFSSFTHKIKKVIQKRKTPLMAHYRINRELMRVDRRMVNAMGSGSIIGDTCQIIDLFCYLTDSLPISISVESMHSSRDDIFPTDNVSAHIAFEDGSVCSFLYTTLGHIDIGSERLEIYFDGKSILMEDYMELYGFGLPSWFNETVTVADKGYEALITQFLQNLYQETYTPIIPIERLKTVAQITLIIDQLACEGGGKQEIV